ncbi:DUF6055 domain-containing protein [Sphingomonas pseudosanguinis]|uniref:Avirulence protein n=1 Tax=Sphingomonas pseudosanguinis TaxID=413712 RepID=A0A7W6AB78_9SPHN|nr:DUF6055 domain-containing protein [Sphingomonas pseudosanguinis]MBB3880669.1 hypothetical protein [Sphingomonas pseudosanguinis]MBN3535665.1 hypothetical protein [Sphingomonas pseudosanguinis]
MRRLYALVPALFLAACGGGEDDTRTASGPVATAASVSTEQPVTGCRATSDNNPWGVLPVRTWTPASADPPNEPFQVPGTAYGPAFEARLIWAYGINLGESSRVAEFEMADGCRRRFRLASLSADDIAAIEQEADNHPLAADTASYATDYDFEPTSQEALDAGTVRKVETQHFTLWYGVKQDGFSYRWARDTNTNWEQFIDASGQWLETIWLWNRDLLNAPMPYAEGSDRKKVNMYVCGTGLPFFSDGDMGDCGATGQAAMWVSAPNLQAGGVTTTHEFGHVIQFHTGGFRDKPDAGPIWEVGAEWNAYVLSPNFVAFMPSYLNNLENGPLWSIARYGAQPFMSFLYDQDSTRPLVWRSWTENLRNSDGATTEDYMQAFVRLGQGAGLYANGFASFADDMGWYGARLAGMDFIDQRALIDATTASATQTLASHLYATLAEGSGAGQYLSSPARPLLQFGTHLIPLTANGGTVQVTLTGDTTDNQAGWRFAIVAIENGTKVTYSGLGAVSGTGSATISRPVPQGAKLFLTVTATPGAYETLGWQQDGAVTGTKFPYRVAISGATAPTGDPAACAPNVAPNTWTLNYNTNGNQEYGRPC